MKNIGLRKITRGVISRGGKKEASRKSAMKFRSRIFLQKRAQKKRRKRERGEKGKILISYKKPVSLPLPRFFARTHVPLLSDFIHSSYDVPSPLSIIRFSIPPHDHHCSTFHAKRAAISVLSPRSFRISSSCSRKTGKAIETSRKGTRPATIDPLSSRSSKSRSLRRRSSRTKAKGRVWPLLPWWTTDEWWEIPDRSGWCVGGEWTRPAGPRGLTNPWIGFPCMGLPWMERDGTIPGKGIPLVCISWEEEEEEEAAFGWPPGTGLLPAACMEPLRCCDIIGIRWPRRREDERGGRWLLRGDGWTAEEGFKTVGRRSTTSARSDPLRFFFASFARNIDRGNRAINRASYRVQNMMEKDLPRRWMDLENWRSMLRLSFNGDNINNEIRKLVEECSSGAASVYHDYRASFRENN